MGSSPNVGMALSKLSNSELVGALVKTPACSLNKYLENVEPWKIVVYTAGGTFLLAYIHNSSKHRVPLLTRIQNFVFKWMRRIPSVKNQIDSELTKIRGNFEEEFGNSVENVPYTLKLPAKGKSVQLVTEDAKLHLNLGDLDWENGAMSGTIYNSSKEVSDLASDVYKIAAWTNPLHPDAFPGLRKMEAEVVSMAQNLFHGGDNACGCVTTGGTESIILACKTYRDLARDTKGVEVGEILAPGTAHAAFDKAADLLGIRIKHVPVDEVSRRVDVRAMKRMITRNTSLRYYQYFCYPDWPGGIYGTPTITGSRAGGIVAACWAAMKHIGHDGYVQATKEIIETTRRITEAVRKVPGLKIIGIPEVSVLAFDSDDFNIYGLSDAMKSRGWALNALQFPACVHLCVTRCHTKPGIAEKFISDVTEITATLMADPGSSPAGSAAIYGMAASIPDRSVVDQCTQVYLDCLYYAPTNKGN